nr:immunoglobulin light chain junction region [Macaca mulatta]MOW34352.1 immunoglobulin light chain junction region [Macaca mulatta]MOW34495.1 immunoglobulin light chain junction region [Macaca mulatta]MOW35417.1 immunoglobulin light chain junction region [Macaca mulatta]MOW35848.1 immunoglobulin light chain junction region [Macaca mulatta]
CLQFHTHPWTF